MSNAGTKYGSTSKEKIKLKQLMSRVVFRRIWDGAKPLAMTCSGDGC
jgi:hypothetical protein